MAFPEPRLATREFPQRGQPMSSSTTKARSRQQSEEWLKAHGYSKPYIEAFDYGDEFKIPKPSHTKFYLIHRIVACIPSEGECLLFIPVWGVAGWPNEELFHRIRESLGEQRRPLHEAPGQMFNLADSLDLECMLDICLCNYWDIVLGDDKHRFLVQFWHDNFVTLACNAESRSDIEGIVTEFKEEQGC
jgi:hypothetical protein